VQLARRACYPPGEAREDWTIIRALSEVLGKTLPLNTLDQVRERLEDVNPVFGAVDRIEPAKWGAFGHKGDLDSRPFETPIANFYITNPVCRASLTMAQCIEALAGEETRKTGTHD
jgi:NADH-quinone oxidoreductase subunit G